LAINAWLLPGFQPVFDPLRGLDSLERSAQLSLAGSGWFTAAAALVVSGLALWGLGLRLRQRFARGPAAGDAGCSCCQRDQPNP